MEIMDKMARPLMSSDPMGYKVGFKEGGSALPPKKERLHYPTKIEKTKKAHPMKEGGDTNWMKNAVKKPGALRKSLHIKKGEKIPLKTLEKATHSKNPLLKKRAVLAETFRKFRQ